MAINEDSTQVQNFSTLSFDYSTEVTSISLPPQPTYNVIAITTVYIIVGMCGIPGNIITIIVMLSSPRMKKKPINRFIINQSLIDLVVCSISVLLQVVDSSSLPTSGLHRELFCRFWLSTYSFWVVAVASSYNLTFLTIERFFAVTNPMKYDVTAVNKRLPFILLGAWLIGIIGPWVNPTITYLHNDECVFTYEYDPPFISILIPFYFFVLDCFIPAVIMVGAYLKMGLTLRESLSSSITAPGKLRVKKAELNIYQTCLMLMIVFVTCWTNNCIAVSLYMSGYFSTMETNYHHISIILITLNSCLNPYVYVVRYKDFQKQTKALFYPRIIREQESINISRFKGKMSDKTKTNSERFRSTVI